MQWQLQYLTPVSYTHLFSKYVSKDYTIKTANYSKKQAEKVLSSKLNNKLAILEQKGYKILAKNVRIVRKKEFYQYKGDVICILPVGKVQYIKDSTLNKIKQEKMCIRDRGKTVSGAVWLDPEKTSPYEFFQYWRNVDDADVIKCLKMLTFLPLEEIEEMEKWQGAELNKAKEILGYELTKLVHGEEEAKKALDAAKNIFAKGGISGDIPTTTYAKAELEQGKMCIRDRLHYVLRTSE